MSGDDHGHTSEARCSCGTPGIDFAGFDRDCPIHGEEPWCATCDLTMPVADEFDDQHGFEEQARPVHVIALLCGHEIVTPGRWAS